MDKYDTNIINGVIDSVTTKTILLMEEVESKSPGENQFFEWYNPHLGIGKYICNWGSEDLFFIDQELVIGQLNKYDFSSIKTIINFHTIILSEVNRMSKQPECNLSASELDGVIETLKTILIYADDEDDRINIHAYAFVTILVENRFKFHVFKFRQVVKVIETFDKSHLTSITSTSPPFTCSVCMEEKNIIHTNSCACSDKFCRPCIRKWKRTNPSCPTCRQAL